MFSQIYKITFIKANFSNKIAFTNVNGIGYVHFVKSLHAYCRKIATRFVIFAKDQKNKYAMTLSELLHSVSFDDLIPTLKEVYGVETDIYAYREAFDELNLLLLFVARTRCGLYIMNNEVCVAPKCLTMNMMNMLSGADIHTGLYILPIVCQ